MSSTAPDSPTLVAIFRKMAEIKLKIRCPIYVARQWGTHRTAKWALAPKELSAINC